MLRRRSVLRLLVLGAATAALALAFAASAFAVPSGTITMADLRTALDATPNHRLDGYMKTVVQGSDITTIECDVTGLPVAGTGVDGSKIVIEATGSLMAKYGGIVAGMSGSPVYLNDGRLVGAVSYGNEFTLGGTGLATPIEAMSLLESYPSPEVPLSTPIITSNGVYNRILVVPDPQNYAAEAKTGAFVAKPLDTATIAGLEPNSTGYKLLKKDLEARGVNVTPLKSKLTAADGGPGSFTAPLVAGASIGAFASRGSMWEGGIGTVTYTDGNNIVAFGHPAYWTGATSYYMTNGYVEGIWPSTDWPFKIADPGLVRGTITQDRRDGVLGHLDEFPLETTITASAIDTDTGHETTSAVYIPRPLIKNGFADGTLVGIGAYMAGSNLFDQASQPGSAQTTTTVVVSDGARQYTITVANYIDDAYDVPSTAAQGVVTAISRLQSTLQWGTQDLEVLSVNLEGRYTSKRVGAQIVGIDTPVGLHVGVNHVTVQALVYGKTDTQTVDTTINIPAGTSLSGALLVEAVSDQQNSSMMIQTSSGIVLSVDGNGNLSPATRQTIAQIADSLNKTLPDTAFKLIYQPGGSATDLSDGAIATTSKAVSTTVLAPWPVTGTVTKSVPLIQAFAEPSTIAYGDFTDVVGEIGGPDASTVVSLYATTAGSSVQTLVATETAVFDPQQGVLSFDFPIDQAFTNTTYRVHIDGSDDWTAADTNVSLHVKAGVNLGTSATKIKRGRTVRLTASVYPNTAAGGTVAFERLSGKRWIKITSKTLAPSGSYAKASLTWKPGKGTQKVRARYLGGLKNYANSSSTKTISVK